MQDGPDLRLARQDQALQVSRNHRDIPSLMRIREGGHAGQPHEGRLKPVSAGGAVFDDQIGQFGAHLAEKALHAFQVLAQAFARGVGLVTAEADGFVIIHLDVTQAAVAQLANHFLAEIFDHPGVSEIPKSPPCGSNGKPIPVQEMGDVLFKAR